MEKEATVYDLEKINDDIYALRTPYKDIFTTVYFIKTAHGALLFDAASYDCDVENAIIPALHKLGIGEAELKYIFISHNHADHSGGLGRLLTSYPNACVVSGSAALREKFAPHAFLSPADGDALLGDLSVVLLPGHSWDSAALYDKRTKMLISGDSLQLYGIFGSGNWGANVSYAAAYAEHIQKLREMDIAAILTAHDYHPYGRSFFGKAEIEAALDACLSPFKLIQKLMEESPDADDEAICKKYNAQGNLPTLGLHVVKKYRETVFCTGSTLFS